jgi:hypothetical protein
VWRLQDLGTRGEGSLVEPINIIHAQVRDIAVIAELARIGYVRTPAEHERHLARTTEPPVARVHIIDLAAENLLVPRTGPVKVVNSKDRVRADEPHSTILRRRSDQCARPSTCADATPADAWSVANSIVSGPHTRRRKRSRPGNVSAETRAVPLSPLGRPRGGA